MCVLSTSVSWQQANNWSGAGLPFSTFAFLIDVALVLDEQETMNLVTGHSRVTGDECIGTFNMTTCSLRSAIGEYNVTIDHDVVTLASTPPEIIQIANNARVNHTVSSTNLWHDSTLSGIIQEIYTELDSAVMTLSTTGGTFSKGANPSPFVEGYV